jgi:hypothetical protein
MLSHGGGSGLTSYGADDSLHTYSGADLAQWALHSGRPAIARAWLDGILAHSSSTLGQAELFSARDRGFGTNLPPHATAAACLIDLLRSQIVSDWGDTLEVGLGADTTWWRGTRLARIATRFGATSVSLDRPEPGTLRVRLDAIAAPLCVTIPPGLRAAEALSEGARVRDAITWMRRRARPKCACASSARAGGERERTPNADGRSGAARRRHPAPGSGTPRHRAAASTRGGCHGTRRDRVVRAAVTEGGSRGDRRHRHQNVADRLLGESTTSPSGRATDAGDRECRRAEPARAAQSEVPAVARSECSNLAMGGDAFDASAPLRTSCARVRAFDYTLTLLDSASAARDRDDLALIHLRLGQLYEMMGLPIDALTLYADGLRRVPGDSVIELRSAWVMDHLKDPVTDDRRRMRAARDHE